MRKSFRRNRPSEVRDAHDAAFTDAPPRDVTPWSPPVEPRGPQGRHRDQHRRRPARPATPIWVYLLVALSAAAAIVGGVLMVHGGTSVAGPHPAPLPSRQFSVDPARIPPPPTDVPTGMAAPARPSPVSNDTAHGSAPAAPASTGQGSAANNPVVSSAPAAPVCRAAPQTGYVVIGRICIDAQIVHTHRLSDGDLVIPDDVQHVGIWGQPIVTAESSGGGERYTVGGTGTTLITGHIDNLYQGAGAFYNLRLAEPGEIVSTTDGDGHTVHWRVISMRVVVKAKLPPSVFNDRFGPRRLVLVTCGGPIVYSPYGNYYLDNVIVTAVPG